MRDLPPAARLPLLFFGLISLLAGVAAGLARLGWEMPPLAASGAGWYGAMVDVMLVLLIIFMIVTPLLQQGVSVNLPRDMVSPDEDGDIAKDTSVVVAIPDNSNFYIGKDMYPIDQLGDVIKRRMEGKEPAKRIVH